MIGRHPDYCIRGEWRRQPRAGAKASRIVKDVIIIILLTRINKINQFYVNEDMIEFIEETPDTILSMNTGKKVVVMESAIEVVEKIREQRIITDTIRINGAPPIREPHWDNSEELLHEVEE